MSSPFFPSTPLTNPVYQHSGETEKINALAQQASVNEDLEQRRRLMDTRGESRRMQVAKGVAHIVEASSGIAHLKSVQTTKEPVLKQAQQTAANTLQTAIAAGVNLFNSVTGKVSSLTKEAANSATHLGHDVADKLSSATNTATEYVSHAAHGAANQAVGLAENIKNTTTHAAEAVTQKTRELADVASHKAHEIADNYTHFTTLVQVLADEENERARRLVSGEEAIAAENAFKVSQLIRDLGFAFYKQEQPNLHYGSKILEETERRWRLNSNTTSRAESNAHLVGKMVSSNLKRFAPSEQRSNINIDALEEKERTRRMVDSNEAYAIINAFAVANIISDDYFNWQTETFGPLHRNYATTLLEENERRSRIRESLIPHDTSSHSIVSDLLGADNLEKFNFSTRHAAHLANDFANKLSNATLRIASTVSAVTKDIAMATAQKVSNTASNIAHFSTLMYITALEEQERTRRINDANQIWAIDNAWRQSQLIRDLPMLYRGPINTLYPIGLIESHERRWRLTNVTPSASRKVAALVSAHHQKFESASRHAAEVEHVLDVASQSRLNPNAPAFVPHGLPASLKVEPIIETTNLKASGAQL